MSLTVTESQAVFDLLRWLADTPRHDGFARVERKVSDDEALEALAILATAAGRRLQLSPDTKLPALIVERLQAADSDGAAQAVCRAIEDEAGRRGHSLADWIGGAMETWRRLQDVELGERLRDQTVDA